MIKTSNYERKTNMKEIQEDIGHFFDITPVIDMRHFVLLLPADLASKSKTVPNDNIAYLPMDYKQRIQDIMLEANGWEIHFSKLIPIETYYEYQRKYEEKLGKMLKKVIQELRKPIEYDIENEVIKIPFTKEEIEKIKNDYDSETLKIMDHFTNLISNYSFSRNYELDHKMNVRNKSRLETQNYNYLVYTLRSMKIKNPEKYLTR